MLRYIKFAGLIIIVLLFSCEKQGLFVNCSECVREEPDRTDLEIRLNLKESERHVIVNVYEGMLEDSVLYATFTAHLASNLTPVNLNKQYTVTATYSKAGIEYVAVDSTIPRVAYEKDQCDNPCYVIYDNVVNLKLKYSK